MRLLDYLARNGAPPKMCVAVEAGGYQTIRDAWFALYGPHRHWCIWLSLHCSMHVDQDYESVGSCAPNAAIAWARFRHNVARERAWRKAHAATTL